MQIVRMIPAKIMVLVMWMMWIMWMMMVMVLAILIMMVMWMMMVKVATSRAARCPSRASSRELGAWAGGQGRVWELEANTKATETKRRKKKII